MGQASIPSGANWANTKTKGIEEEAGDKELGGQRGLNREEKAILIDFRLCEKGSQLYQMGKYVPFSEYLV